MGDAEFFPVPVGYAELEEVGLSGLAGIAGSDTEDESGGVSAGVENGTGFDEGTGVEEGTALDDGDGVNGFGGGVG